MEVNFLGSLFNSVSSELLKAITGKLLTDTQIQMISNNAVGTYFKDWLPETKQDKKARERIEQARFHFAQASGIINTLQNELQNQTNQLDQLERQIEEKMVEVQHYSVLAKVNQDEFDAYKSELQLLIKKELQEESERGKRFRQVAKVIEVTITLILGAVLGEYFPEIISFFQAIFQPGA